MPRLLLDSALIPEPRWNTHIACLARLTDAAGLGHDLTDTAGLTGLAFRTALTRQVTPSGLYLSWAWAPEFTRFLAALGLDADVTCHRVDLPGWDDWLSRQHARIWETLERGFPVLHWDNAGFSLILGADEDGYFISSVGEQTVHPLWHEQEHSRDFAARLMPRVADDRRPAHIPRDQLASTVEPEGLFAYVHSIIGRDPEEAAIDSVMRAYLELSGRVEYPRVKDSLHHVYEPRFGTAAIDRWREELKDGRIHHFGMILAIQALGEARRFAAQYLKRVAEQLPGPQQDRLKQAGLFFERVREHLRPVLAAFDVPLDPEQMKSTNWEKCREALYQAQKTEQTASRLLAAVAQELAG